MESKLVYLFELDSVRKTDQEILEGQKALYDELIHHGNDVVLTYNQLVDSRAFFSLFSDPKSPYYRSFVNLFENKHILLSQYGEIRTLSQYLLNSISPDKHFIYSALPIKCSQRRLLALMRRSLVYSDLSEIGGYIDGSMYSTEELKDLFVEIQDDGTEKASSLSNDNMMLALKHLRSLLSIVLKLSTLNGSYIPPRDPKEINNLRLWNILSRILNTKSSHPLWKPAKEVIFSLSAYQSRCNSRSQYLQQLYRRSLNEREKQAYQFAEAIVDLCFNYACEISICGTSKRYDPQELLCLDVPAPSFEKDFETRLEQYWNQGSEAEHRFLQSETNVFIPFRKPDNFPNFAKAVRLLDYDPELEENRILEKLSRPVPRYEFHDVQQQKSRKHQILKTILIRVIFSLLCFLIAVFLQIFFNELQNAFDVHLPEHSVIILILETILFLLLSEWLSSAIAKHWKGFLSLSDALKEIGALFSDVFHTLFWRIPDNNQAQRFDKAEQKSTSIPIRFITPEPIKKYQSLEQKQGPLQIQSSAHEKLADVMDPETVGTLIRQEETSNRMYGMIYQSPYNTLLVDPIVRSDSNIFPYERILPTEGDGVILVVMCHGKFILLNQFRHALQEVQLSFPRGFAEPGEDGEKNAVRELMEELNATPIAPPVYLGDVAPDSGLTSRKSKIYFIKIDSYHIVPDYEGIIDTLEVTKEQLQEMIRRRTINDAYTIAAFTYWMTMQAG